MDDRTIFWILGSIISLVTTVVLYILRELSDLRKRFHTRNNDLSTILTEIQVDARGVSEMVKANDKSNTEIKVTMAEVQKTLARLANELSRLSGLLNKD